MGGRDAFLQAGLAGAIGTVETRPIDLVGAFGSLGNLGVHVPTRMILSIDGPGGGEVYRAPDPAGTQAVSPQSAFLMTNILAGNTDPGQNAWWSKTLSLRNGPNGQRRPAAAKTGTADNRRDFSTYGYLAPPKDPGAPAVAVGVWMGNSDHSAPQTSKQATSLTSAGEVWHAFLRDYTAKWPIADFPKPTGVVQATIDRWSGGKPGPWTQATIREWFADGTQPGAKHGVDPAGLLYSQGCSGWMVDPVKAELGPQRWRADVADWVRRARSGPGVRGPLGSTTTYRFGSWGGSLLGPCAPQPQPQPQPGSGNGHDNGHGNGHGNGRHGPPPPPPPPATPATQLPGPGQNASPRRRLVRGLSWT
jgi:membrane peptidoglycan carboxypeptidase